MPARSRLSSGKFAPPDNYLAYMDQAMFDGHRVAGQNEIMQAVWVYEHPIDVDGLKRAHRNLSDGLMGRLIKPSPLPFGRHRWVSSQDTPGIDVADSARPRNEVSDWADERAQLEVDAVRGPGWHLGVQALTDGSTAVSLVVSHYVLDGVGVFFALFEAAVGNVRDLGYPPPRSGSRVRAVVQDARQAARDSPAVLRAFATAVRLNRNNNRRNNAGSPAPISEKLSGATHYQADDDHEVFTVPWVSVHVASDLWESRAKALGGTTNTLAAGLAAKLGQRLGRQRPDDGLVALLILASQRTPDDTRALAVSYPRVAVDPTRATTDLRDIRSAIKLALTTPQETTEVPLLLAPLAPFTPTHSLKRMVQAALNEPDLPVVYSHLGDPPPGARGIDGTDAEYVTARAAHQHLTRHWLEQTSGHAILLSARFPSSINLTFQAYQPGAANTKSALVELVLGALAEFGLTGDIE